MASAANLQIYSLINVLINGQLFAQEASCSVDQATNSQIVKTVALGYAGESPGAPMSEVSIDTVLPEVGFETAQLVALVAMDTLIPVQFTFFVASNELQFNGFVINRSMSHAVDTESKMSLKARGSFASFIPVA